MGVRIQTTPNLDGVKHFSLEAKKADNDVEYVELKLPPLQPLDKREIQRAAQEPPNLYERFGGWLSYMGNNFKAEIYLEEDDRERTEEALSKLSLGELRDYKRALVENHPQYWEFGRHVALKDPKEGSKKREQIKRIFSILTGEIFSNSSEARAKLGRLHRWTQAHIEQDPSINGMIRSTASLRRSAKFAVELEKELVGDTKALGKLKAVRQSIDRLLSRLEPVEQQIESDFAALREQVKNGTFDFEVLNRIGDQDSFAEWLFSVHHPPTYPEWKGTERLGYQPTPLFTIKQMLEKVPLTPDDQLVDLGCGMGKVLLFAAASTGCHGFGVEYNEELAGAATKAVESVGLQDQVKIENGDAGNANYQDGTVFFFFNPFRGSIMDRTMERVKEAAKKRQITICTTGPTHLGMAMEWLKPEGERPYGVYDVTVYKSDPALIDS